MSKHTVSLRTVRWTDSGECLDTTQHFVNRSADVANRQAREAVEKMHRCPDLIGVEMWWLEHTFNGETLWFHGRTLGASHSFNVSPGVRDWSEGLAYWYPFQPREAGRPVVE